MKNELGKPFPSFESQKCISKEQKPYFAIRISFRCPINTLYMANILYMLNYI